LIYQILCLEENLTSTVIPLSLYKFEIGGDTIGRFYASKDIHHPLGSYRLPLTPPNTELDPHIIVHKHLKEYLETGIFTPLSLRLLQIYYDLYIEKQIDLDKQQQNLEAMLF
jgi:hypothetical protein